MLTAYVDFFAWPSPRCFVLHLGHVLAISEHLPKADSFSDDELGSGAYLSISSWSRQVQALKLYTDQQTQCMCVLPRGQTSLEHLTTRFLSASKEWNHISKRLGENDGQTLVNNLLLCGTP